ncbi:hypothetical protein AUEXF2481DRAFT_598958 [Aureobasidium subglaciale EXF-2481]|uniref:Uncharacterized protein n=1 Tax=Aureobasidium subglaciale (strain EXF-2481) TaxID=1043005 RepID=A0A074YMV3_AURSE|nr:uncharacterized protein AUEXF2481DRAFT_598958 [Aureobasidium subglaciale EXF-2481]KEQ97439.1 hypothetical protein AUEXF2481DRAFT_598958 [Aureobasidium subglaciale EXF-2481]
MFIPQANFVMEYVCQGSSEEREVCSRVHEHALSLHLHGHDVMVGCAQRGVPETSGYPEDSLVQASLLFTTVQARADFPPHLVDLIDEALSSDTDGNLSSIFGTSRSQSVPYPELKKNAKITCPFTESNHGSCHITFWRLTSDTPYHLAKRAD